LGVQFSPVKIKVASFAAQQLEVYFNAELKGPGLILYELCASGNVAEEVWILLMRYIIKKMNQQRKQRTFQPIDLGNALAREGQLSDLARILGVASAVGVASISWKFFWRAVVKRFALRGAVAELMLASLGPIGVGELITAGLLVWTLVDIVRLNDELWASAQQMQRTGTLL
jgi:hypothetical protein